MLGTTPLPFNFLLEPNAEQIEVFLLNGTEKMPVEKTSLRDSIFELAFPSYSNRIVAELNGNHMQGHLLIERPAKDPVKYAFSAVHGQSYRYFSDKSNDHVDITGTWRLELDYTGSGNVQTYIGQLQQDGDQLTANFASPRGDFRFLAGQVRSNQFWLSIFDGGLTQAWSGNLLPDGTLTGTTSNGMMNNSPWRAERMEFPESCGFPSYEVVDSKLVLAPFNLPSCHGGTISFPNPNHQGKAIALIMAASWCPTCHDIAGFIQPLINANKARGLTAIYCMFEFSAEWPLVENQVLAFLRRYNIDSEAVFAGHCEIAQRNTVFPDLPDITAFPTVFLLDKKHQLRFVLPSFCGPATGELHRQSKRLFTDCVEAVLAE